MRITPQGRETIHTQVSRVPWNRQVDENIYLELKAGDIELLSNNQPTFTNKFRRTVIDIATSTNRVVVIPDTVTPLRKHVGDRYANFANANMFFNSSARIGYDLFFDPELKAFPLKDDEFVAFFPQNMPKVYNLSPHCDSGDGYGELITLQYTPTHNVSKGGFKIYNTGSHGEELTLDGGGFVDRRIQEVDSYTIPSHKLDLQKNPMIIFLDGLKYSAHESFGVSELGMGNSSKRNVRRVMVRPTKSAHLERFYPQMARRVEDLPKSLAAARSDFTLGAIRAIKEIERAGF